MAVEGFHDHWPAKRKAAARLGVKTTHLLPANEEIDAALAEFHRLYRADRHAQHIRHLRLLALEAMSFLRPFSPRLVGGVLEGWAGDFSPISLELHPATREEVMVYLAERDIPFREFELAEAGETGRPDLQPGLGFLVDGIEVRLLLAASDRRPGNTTRGRNSADTETVAALIALTDHGTERRGLAVRVGQAEVRR